MLPSNICFISKMSLSFLWIMTGLTSAFFAREIGYDILVNNGFTASLANLSILLGSIIDVSIGIWLLTGKNLKLCYLMQLLMIITYSLLLTAIEPVFWLHPFGPLTKNIPLIVMIYILYSHERSLQ
ncbi:DoxX-like family protein [Pseudomonas sp. HK3]